MSGIRRGPRPLLFHLLMQHWAATTAAATSWSASTTSNVGWPLSKAGQAEAARIGAALDAGDVPAEAWAAAVARRLLDDEATLLAGIAAYRRQPCPGRPVDPPCRWRDGATRLLDYGGDGPALLFVPSLVNRAHVLDLLPAAPGGSMLRWLAAQGCRPLLLDWGEPGSIERSFDLTDYIAGRLERGIGAAVAAAGGPVLLVGYCMGGLLALAAAQRRPERIRGLALLATPWDFWAAGEGDPRAVARALPPLEPLLASGPLPVDALQLLFAIPEPFAIAARYRAFARLDPDSDRARRFVAIEDWLNDGVPLAAAVAREVLGGWYGANTPARGEWRVAGAVVLPDAAPMPTFVAVPARDRIVPPATALALAAARPGCVVHHAAAGHVGMVAGASAERALWQPLASWAKGV